MTKVQKAFRYLLDLLNDVYETGWILSEALEDAAIEFSLNKHEIEQLRSDYAQQLSTQQSRN
jgi:hypothetical protein